MVVMESSSSSSYLLEINLISAQNLKTPSTNLRRMQTYAIAYIDPSFKLRTRIDRIGSENPTWNDKFVFRVSSDFLSDETSAVSIEIYSVGVLKDPLIGTVRFLIGNRLGVSGNIGVPSFSALQIRRPSGRFHGVLNINSMVINGSDFSNLPNGVSAIGYRDLMGENNRKRRKSRRKLSSDENSSCSTGEESWETGSSCSSTSTTSTVLKDWNGGAIRDLVAGNKQRLLCDGPGLLCGLGFQRKIHFSPSDQNLQMDEIICDENSRV